MANALYDPGREGFLDGSINWSANDMRAMLVMSTYTFVASHKFIANLGAVDNGRTGALANKTVANGAADADDTTLIANGANACKAIVLFQQTGNDSTARLIGYIDTPTSGLPFTPSANQTVNIAWDSGTNKIFKL
jgi:hypothetical protein